MRAIITALFLILFSQSAGADWTRVKKGDNAAFYLDFERVRKQDGLFYYWTLIDYSERDKFGDLSAVSYKQGDCKKFRFKTLWVGFYSEPMRGGTKTDEISEEQDWKFPLPDSATEAILKIVCLK